MKKIFLSIIFVILGITAFGQVSNKNLEIKKASPQIYLNGTNPLIKTNTDTFALKSDVSTAIADIDDVDYETAIKQSDAYKLIYQPWKFLYPESDVVLKTFNTDMHPPSSNVPLTATDSRMYLYLLDSIPESTLITGPRAMQSGSSTPVYTGDNYNGFVLYKLDGDSIRLIDTTTNDSEIWKVAAGGMITAAFSQAPLTLEPGWYYVGTLANHSATSTSGFLAGWNISFAGMNNLYGLPVTKKYRIIISTQTTPAAAYALSDVSNGIATGDVVLYYTPE